MTEAVGIRSEGMEQVCGEVPGWLGEVPGERGIDNRGDSDRVGSINLVSLRGFGGSGNWQRLGVA